MVKAPEAGFQFDLAKRNAYLEAKGVKPPAPWKTGTTIAGIIFKVRECLNPRHNGRMPMQRVRALGAWSGFGAIGALSY